MSGIPAPVWEDQRTVLELNDITFDETVKALKQLKNWKAPGPDEIPAGLMKLGGKLLHETIYGLCECTPMEWGQTE